MIPPLRPFRRLWLAIIITYGSVLYKGDQPGDHMYAKDMSEEFKGLAPMHSFFSALASDTRPPPGIGKTRVDMETLKKFALLKHGEIVDLHSVEADIREIEVADLVESPGAVRLAKIAGGDWTWSSGPTPSV